MNVLLVDNDYSSTLQQGKGIGCKHFGEVHVRLLQE